MYAGTFTKGSARIATRKGFTSFDRNVGRASSKIVVVTKTF